MTIDLHAVAPDDPRALDAMGRYLREIDTAFTGGYDPGAEDLEPYRAPGGVFLVAVADGQPVGCGALRQLGDHIGEIKRMWVDPSTRGTGLGRRLLAALEDEALLRGSTRVRLDTNDVLHAALGLYRSSGYVEIERYNDNPYARHWFEKSLAR